MKPDYNRIFQQAYDAFNRRDIPAVLALMSAHVKWANGSEGGYVEGHSQVHDYWERQWKEVNPIVNPISVTERKDGTVEVIVQQLVKDMKGNTLFDGIVKHIYTFENGLIEEMRIGHATDN